MNSKLRLAKLEDSALLLEWRNDIKTRESSHNTNIITKEEHMEWLKNIIESNDNELYVYEENEVPLGTVRSDLLKDNTYEFSWTVAPNSRGKGVAKKMVKLLTDEFDCTIIAKVKVGNTASSRVAQHAGMRLVKIENGIEYYRKLNVKT